MMEDLAAHWQFIFDWLCHNQIWQITYVWEVTFLWLTVSNVTIVPLSNNCMCSITYCCCHSSSPAAPSDTFFKRPQVFFIRRSANWDTSNPHTKGSNFLMSPRLGFQPFIKKRWAHRIAPSCNAKPANSKYSTATRKSSEKPEKSFWREKLTVQIKLYFVFAKYNPYEYLMAKVIFN